MGIQESQTCKVKAERNKPGHGDVGSLHVELGHVWGPCM